MASMLVFAGPNGSGKSTITSKYPIVGAYVNADEIQRKLGCDAMEAAKIATSTREKLLEAGKDFSFETVLSTPRNIDLMEKARSCGYYIMCVYVLTRDPGINEKRVDARIARGGNFVEREKIRPRYIRAMRLILDLCCVANRVLFFDNSGERDSGGPFLIAEVNEGQATINPCKYWSYEEIQQLLGGQYFNE